MNQSSARIIVAGIVLCLPLGPGCDSDDTIMPVETGPAWSWQNPLPHGYALHGIGGWTEFDLWVVGEYGTIGRYDGRFEFTDSPTQQNLYDVIGFRSGTAFAVGAAGTILEFDGTRFQTVASPVIEDLVAIWGTDFDNLVAVGNNGTLITRDATGWTDASLATSTDFNSVWGVEKSGDAMVVGDGGLVLRWDGADWIQQSQFTSSNLNGVWASKPDDWFAVGDGGEIWQGRGASWSASVSGTTADLFSVSGSDSAYVFAVGAGDSALFYDKPNWIKVFENAPGRLLGA